MRIGFISDVHYGPPTWFEGKLAKLTQFADELTLRFVDRMNREFRPDLVVNLGETQHLNSTALGVLISAHSSYVRRGGHMKLCAVDKRIENIFVITKLTMVFEICETEEQAVAGF